jgi:hypothetical protein
MKGFVVVVVAADRMMMKFDKNNFEFHKYLNVVEIDDYKLTYLFVEQLDKILVDNMMSRINLSFIELKFSF